jgi:hypothetical protein
MKDDGQTIKGDIHEPSNYAMIPKMAMIDLEPYELVLYCHYKITAAEEGDCWKSNKTLARETGMSETKIKETRLSLVAKGFITLIQIADENGNINTPPVINVVNVWAENRKRYTKKEAPTPSRHAPTPSRHAPTPQSPRATKVSVLETEPSNKDTSANASGFPRSIKSYKAEHIQAYQAQHLQDVTALVKAWAGDMYSSITEFGDKVGRMYIEVHQELIRLNKPATDYLALANYTKKKDAWKSSPVPTDMLMYVTEYASKPAEPQPTPKPESIPSSPIHKIDKDFQAWVEQQKAAS